VTGGANKLSLLSSKSSSYTTIETAKSESVNLTLAVIFVDTCNETSNSIYPFDRKFGGILNFLEGFKNGLSVKLSTVLDISIIGLLVSFLSVSNALSEISQILTNLNGSLTAVASPGIATESITTTAFKPN
jgi:hypothetical protein